MVAILEALELLEDEDINVDIYALFACGEETGYIGARTGAFRIDPDLAIALDVGNAYVPDADMTRKQNVLGGGGVISYSATLDLDNTEGIINVAKEKAFPIKWLQSRRTREPTDTYFSSRERVFPVR